MNNELKCNCLEEEKNMFDDTTINNVNHPKHYEDHSSFECIETMLIAFGIDFVQKFCLGNAYKYIWRHKFKNKLEDLNKAKWYLDNYNKLAEENKMFPDFEKYKELVKILSIKFERFNDGK